MSTESGRAAEDVAAAYLRAQGMTVVTRNWRGGGGELDLVLLDGETFVFAEVKSRSDLTEAVAAVDASKVDRLFRAAQHFLRDGGLAPDVVRFDIVAVDPASGEVTHLTDAFRP